MHLMGGTPEIIAPEIIAPERWGILFGVKKVVFYFFIYGTDSSGDCSSHEFCR